MDKKDIIKEKYHDWKQGNTTIFAIARKLKTSKSYVKQVLRSTEIQEEIKAKVFEDEAKKDGGRTTSPNIEEPEFNWEDTVSGRFQQKREIKPKVNLLPNGKVELIYKSIM